MSLLHHDATDELIEAQLPPVERRWLKWLRCTGWTLVALYFIVAIGMLSLRFWVLPAVADHKPQIEAAVSRALGKKGPRSARSPRSGSDCVPGSSSPA